MGNLYTPETTSTSSLSSRCIIFPLVVHGTFPTMS